jgi:hypothetical protein
MVKDAIITQELENHREKLEFIPNDYALSLDVTSLEAPKNGVDYQAIITVSATVIGVLLITASVFIFRAIRAKRFHKKHKIDR